ncbi:MAG TPA: GntR family transcriptional regulator [Caldilineaceae bacterium]|nr:FadR family transcriptional regulator [Caldilineaceae bacterium]HRW05038.1 GntR family transcriptional regulator [Caldilineaceae bacterium]
MTTDNIQVPSPNGKPVMDLGGDGATLQPIAEINRGQEIRDRLKRYIIQNKLRPGDKLPTEETLGNRLGVSRSAVREALRSMEALGIIEARQGYGRVVCDFTFDAILNNLSYGFAFLNHNFLQMLEIRKALDVYFIAAAIANLTAADLDTLTATVDRMATRAEQGLDISQEDYAFHALLFARAENPLAVQLFEIQWAVRMNAYHQPTLDDLLPGTAAKHAAVLDAIKQGDVLAAQQTLLDHHRSIEQWFHQQIAAEDAQ